MQHYIKEGIRNLNDIKNHYNSFQDGGNLYEGRETSTQKIETAPWYKRKVSAFKEDSEPYKAAEEYKAMSQVERNRLHNAFKNTNLGKVFDFASPVDMDTSQRIGTGNFTGWDAAIMGASVLPVGKYLGKGVDALKSTTKMRLNGNPLRRVNFTPNELIQNEWWRDSKNKLHLRSAPDTWPDKIKTSQGGISAERMSGTNRYSVVAIEPTADEVTQFTKDLFPAGAEIFEKRGLSYSGYGLSTNPAVRSKFGVDNFNNIGYEGIIPVFESNPVRMRSGRARPYTEMPNPILRRDYGRGGWLVPLP